MCLKKNFLNVLQGFSSGLWIFLIITLLFGHFYREYRQDIKREKKRFLCKLKVSKKSFSEQSRELKGWCNHYLSLSVEKL